MQSGNKTNTAFMCEFFKNKIKNVNIRSFYNIYYAYNIYEMSKNLNWRQRMIQHVKENLFHFC